MSENSIDRRRLLQSATFAGLVGVAGEASSAEKRQNVIQIENQRPGTTDWQLTRVWPNSGLYRTKLIEGYCSHQSIRAAETLSVFVSTDPAREFKLDLYRMGFYGGAGARRVASYGPVAGAVQPTPASGDRRLRECKWEPSLKITIPDDWVSGVYLGKLTTIAKPDEPYWQSYVIFIVADDRSSDVMFQCSDNTWQAYNRWPENDSLYTHPGGAHHPDVAVSFDRPYGKYNQIFDHPLSIGSGEFLLWEYPLCYWLEQQGYDVTYVSNSDVRDARSVTRCNAFLSVGHDEYWDLRQYRAIQDGMDQGVNVLWLSGNSVYMVSPFEASSMGNPDRVISRKGCYGELRSDESTTYKSVFGPLESAGPDERRIIGARTIVPFNGGGDWQCVRPDHWLFEGTRMNRGDAIPGLVGWEYHGEPDLSLPGMTIVAEGTAWAGGRRPGHWTATIFDGPKNNFVFNASTIFWSQALASPPGHILPWSHFSRPHGVDPRVQRMTENLLRRARRG